MHKDVFRGDFYGRGGLREGITWEDRSIEEFFMGERNFSWRGNQISYNY